MAVILNIPSFYEGGANSDKEGELIDTSTLTSKDETLNKYGSKIYIMESSYTEGLSSLATVVERWGGTTVDNNYIGNSSSKYGINMANGSEQNIDTSILFFTPVKIENNKLIFIFNCACNSLTNSNLNIHLISAIGDTEEEIISNLQAKIDAQNYDLTQAFTFSGSSSLTDVLVEVNGFSKGNYYLYIDGTQKADNSNLTFINIRYINWGVKINAEEI